MSFHSERIFSTHSFIYVCEYNLTFFCRAWNVNRFTSFRLNRWKLVSFTFWFGAIERGSSLDARECIKNLAFRKRSTWTDFCAQNKTTEYLKCESDLIDFISFGWEFQDALSLFPFPFIIPWNLTCTVHSSVKFLIFLRIVLREKNELILE